MGYHVSACRVTGALENAMDLSLENLSRMTPEQERQFWEQFEGTLDSDTGEAARAHLAAGHPIYYTDNAYPGQIVREYPDGRRELVSVDAKGQATVLQGL
jgi:hypothetical protein